MEKRGRGQFHILIIAFIILAAFCCRPLARNIDNEFVDKVLNFTRTFLYLGLFGAWGVSVQQRVMQVEVRRYLLTSSCLMVLWIAIREIKWRFVLRTDILRYLWYSYYIPILMIPLFALLVSMSLGKTTDYRLPKWTGTFYLPTLLLIVMVLTNDFHQKVFRFPAAAKVWTEREYSYGSGYWLVFAWGIICSIAAFIIIIKRARIPKSGKTLWLPLVPIGLAIFQIFIFIARVPVIQRIFGDLAVFDSLVFTGFFESCIFCGLIQSNTRYGDLFRAAEDLSVQIVDRDYNLCYYSQGLEPIPRYIMEEAERGPVNLQNGRQVHNMHIHGGHAIWTEDLSEILSLRETLQDRQEELTDRNALLQLKYDKEKQYRIIEEQNRLYDLLQNETQDEINQIEKLVRSYRQSESEGEKKRILSHILILGVYIKRRKDFALSLYGEGRVSAGKLNSALSESYRALKTYGVRGGFLLRMEKDAFEANLAAEIYDFFQEVLEAVLDKAAYLNTRVISGRDGIRVSMLMDCPLDGGIRAIKGKYPEALILDEGEETHILLWPKRGVET
ncbi:MAG: hypothetical protein K5989_01700 [Lachnospiraceae bacterium]|nr:hypothetical protein [Lachnospiraceae bacterium]